MRFYFTVETARKSSRAYAKERSTSTPAPTAKANVLLLERRKPFAIFSQSVNSRKMLDRVDYTALDRAKNAFIEAGKRTRNFAAKFGFMPGDFGGRARSEERRVG